MPAPSRRHLTVEIWIVLGLSLGASGVYSVLTLLRRLTADTALRDQSATMHRPLADQPWLDLTYQLVAIGFALVPVALAIYLIALHPGRPWTTLGLTRSRLGRAIADGFGLTALIGLPGLAFYLLGRELGWTVGIVASDLDRHWWAVPVLVLSAIRAGLIEEIIAVGYLMTRLKQLSWGVPAVILASSVLRGSYHLYQGIGPGLGNMVMGVVFAWYYHRTGRLWPLVIAHASINIVAFLGYTYLGETLGIA